MPTIPVDIVVATKGGLVVKRDLREIGGLLDKIPVKASRAKGSVIAVSQELEKVARTGGTGSPSRLPSLEMMLNIVKSAADSAGSAITNASRIGTLSQSLGLPSGDLQSLTFAAERSHSNRQAVEEGLKQATLGLGRAQIGEQSSVADALDALDINLKDSAGNFKTIGPVFDDIIEAFQTIDSGAERAARAVQLFGEDAGFALLPLLSRGPDGIDRLREESRAFDVVLDPDTIEFAQSADRLIALVVDGLFSSTASQNFLNSSRSALAGVGGIEGIETFLRDNTGVFQGPDDLVELGSDLLKRSKDAMQDFGNDVGSAVEGTAEEVERQFRDLQDTVLQEFESLSEALKGQLEDLGKFLRENQTPPVISPEAAKAFETLGSATIQLASSTNALVVPLRSLVDLREREATATAILVATAGREGKLGGEVSSPGVIPASFTGVELAPGSRGAGGNLESLARGFEVIKGPTDTVVEASERFAGAQGQIAAVLREESLPALEAVGATTAVLADETRANAAIIEEVLRGAFGRVEQALLAFVETGKLNFKDLIRSILLDIAQLMISRLFNQFVDILLGGLLGTAGGAITTAATSVSGGSVGGTVGLGVANVFGAAFGGGLGASGGGLVRGPGTATSDSILARLSDGEFVVSARAVGRHRDILEAINDGGLAAFRFGGLAEEPGDLRMARAAFDPLRPISLDERLAPLTAGNGQAEDPREGDLGSAADVKEMRVILGDIRRELRRGTRRDARRNRGPREEGIGFGRSEAQLARQSARSAEAQLRRN